MAVLTLDEIKEHLRLDLEDPSQDAHLTLLSSAAEDYASQYLGRSLPWQDDQGADVAVPFSVKAALLLTIADLYENREDTVVGTIVGRIGAVERLLHFHRVGLGI